MIKSIDIKNFKLYKDNTVIPLSNINLLTGTNGKGKSSVLQAFLLLSQSALKNRIANKIILNGNNVKLGSMDDVKNKDTPFSEPINFKFSYDNFNISYELFQQQPDGTELDINKIEVSGILDSDTFEFDLTPIIHDFYGVTKIKNTSGTNSDFATSIFDLFINSNSFTSDPKANLDCQFVKRELNLSYIHYVSADRSGPKNYYENRTLGHFVTVGALGEDTVNVLFHKGSDQVDHLMLEGYCKLFQQNEDEIITTIEEHTNLWLNKIFQGAKIAVTNIRGEDLLKLRISSDNGAKYFKPTNVGYGFSYSLPIIVAGLIAKPKEILIVENPEAHLHPYAQSLLAKFLALVSATGVQVLIESHSEHILNGLRVAVHEGLISNQDLNVLYFDKKGDNLFEKVNVDKDGGIDNWPSNFFDQSSNDLNILLGL